MRIVNQFWQSLEAVSGQSDILSEWQRNTGEDFDLSRYFLRPTDRRALVFRCPTPGGEGCPRRVVVHDNGDIVAACANTDWGCDNVSLTESDIIVHTLDRYALSTAVAECLDLQPAFSEIYGHKILFCIGEDIPFPGKRFSVFMILPRNPEGLREAVISLLALMDGPFIILTPTGRHLEADIASLLARVGAVHLPLVDILGVNGDGLLEALSPPYEIMRDFRLSVTPQPQAGSSLEHFPTPATASWEQVTIAHEVVRRMEKSLFTGKTLTLKVKFADFRQITRSRTVDHPIIDAKEIMNWTRFLFAPVDIPPQGVRLLGLTISNACNDGESRCQQMVLPFFVDYQDEEIQITGR